MKRSIFYSMAIAIVIITQSVAVAQQASIKKMPVANWIRSKKIDIKHIKLDLHFDWKKKQAKGNATITVSQFNPGNSVALDAGMLTINSIVLADQTPLTFRYNGGDANDNLLITLDRIYKAGEEITFKIDYNSNWVNETDPNNIWGSTGKGIRFFEPSSTEPKRRRQIWSTGEPESNRYWFPGYDSPNDQRTTEFIATVDDPLMAISNGVLIDSKDNKNGTHTFHWKMDTPYSNYQTSFVVGEFVDIKQNYGDVQLHSFGYPDEAEATAASVVRLPDMVKYFSEVTGQQFPFPAYSQVFVQELPNWMGNMTSSTVTENMVDDDRTHADYFYLWDITEAEALAHQWFGSYLTCRDWSQLWLSKGFAHYFNQLYGEYKNGRDEFLLYNHLFDNNAVYLNDWNAGIRHPLVTKNYESPLIFANDNYPTQRGALVLHMLRKQLGEENWWKAVRLYVRSNANKLVGTEDLQRAVEESTGEPMDWFFDQWVYKMGHPVFEIKHKYDESKKQLQLTVRQTQKIDSTDEYPQVEFFKGKVEISIDGRIEQVWLEAKAENVFSFSCPRSPKLVNFDYESTWIKEMSFEKPVDELLYQLQYDKDILGRNWAMGKLFNLAKNEATSAGDKEKIYAGFRDLVTGNSYWRLRLNTMSQLQNLFAPGWSKTAVLKDEATISMLLNIIKNEKAWLRTAAISFLGMTRDPKYAEIYMNVLNDESDRVINAAAIALGKSKSPKAFNVLKKLKDKPSWKNQSLISALNGLKELGDPRGFDIAFKAMFDLHSPRWTLATPVWDFRITAAETIVTLGKAGAGYPLILARLKKAMSDNDLNSIFNNVLLITILADPRGEEAFSLLKIKFKDNENAMVAVNQYETQFNEAIKKN